MPLLCKDDLKELLFDRLGWGDAERSRAMSDAAYDLLFHVCRVQVAAGCSLMIEGNFRPDAADTLERMRTAHPYSLVQIHCYADRQTLTDRLIRRARERLRHPGHLDSEDPQAVEALIDSGAALGLEGPLIRVDTDGPVALESLAAEVRRLGAMPEEEGNVD